MSASPAGPPGMTPNGSRAGTTPNGSAPSARRRPPKPKANPLVQPRRPKGKLQPSRKTPQAGTLSATNQMNPASNGAPRVTPARSALYEDFRPPEGVKVDCLPVFTTKRAMLAGLRHHVMKFQTKTNIDPTDQSEFTRPIRLHRRDAGLGKSGAGADSAGEGDENDEESKERARIDAQREERRRNREEIQAQIAPKAKGKSGYTDNKKKIQQVYERNDTPEAIKASRLRYEETLPWHLEDFDNKNTWVGGYEAALSDSHVMMFKEPGIDPQTGQARMKLRMVPIEKWYKFSAKDKAVLLSLEDIDKQEKTGVALTRWALHTSNGEPKKKEVPAWMQKMEVEKERKKLQEEYVTKSKGLFLRSAGRGDEEVSRKKPGLDDDDYIKSEAADADVIDFDENEAFADDEEGVNGLFEGDDEDKKAAEDKIKREQLSANFFANNDEKDVWEKEEEDQLEAELKRKLEKSLRKKIVKREKNYNYDLHDSDENPYSEDSDTDDSEVERQKEEERKREEERAAAEKGKAKVTDTTTTTATTTEKPASGSSSKGTTTPSMRPKTGDPLKLSSSQVLKRPGSPNLSEASGNESSRKKQKKHAGSGSDSDATDSGKPLVNRLKNNPGDSQAGTPGGSRAGSPVLGGATSSRAGSPASAGGSFAVKSRPTVPSASRGPPPTVEEIRAVIPPGGASMTQLIAAFKGRIKQGNSPEQRDFIMNVKLAGRYDKDRRMIFPK